ncbi:MAG TPA: GH3 auxin-responsive promoter family protein, partial [Stellaceae bacterium]
AVPLRHYEDFWSGYWQPVFPNLIDISWPGRIPFFAASSGTSTGATKFIPVTSEMIASNRQAGLDLLVHHLRARPRSRIFAGRNLLLGGSTDLVEQAPGVKSGDLSGIATATIPSWARAFAYPPPDIARLTDWSEKMARLADAALQSDIRSIAGTPSWLLLFFDELARRYPERSARLADFFPDLEVIIHGGVNFAPYRARFAEWLDGSRAETREVYAASEGFIAGADRGEGEGMRVNLDHGIFYEFVPVEEIGAAQPTRHWIGDIETGIDYAPVLTSCAGLWAYVVGDIVRFVERDPPRLLVTGRLSYTLSAFGEHLTGEEIEAAVTAAAEAISAGVRDFAAGAVYPEKSGEIGGHLFVVEFERGVSEAELGRFAETLDRDLMGRNLDYEAHRAGGYGLRPPEVVALRQGGFAEWMRRRGRLGSQNKVPRIIADPALFAELRAFADANQQPLSAS